MNRWRTTLITLALAAVAVPASAQDLFISEYVEGSSNNKAIEIYNPTVSAVDLAAVSGELRFYFNGSVSVGTTIPLTGIIAAGGTYVVADNDAVQAILDVADQQSAASFYNGDDAVALAIFGSEIDVIGQIGFDPGSEWGTGDQSTANNTIRRNQDVCTGDPNGTDPFDPSVQWTGFPQDTFDGLGGHTAACDPVPLGPQSWGLVKGLFAD